jgi:hypothetical protein
VAAVVSAWQQATSGLPVDTRVPRLEGVWHYVPLAFLIAAGIVWFAGRHKASPTAPETPALQPVQQAKASFPTISALYNRIPDVSRAGIDEYFRRAHHSPVTAEVENNIKIAVRDLSANDREELYSRLIGVGMVSYGYDEKWWAIFKSQLLLLTEMNRKNGWISLRKARQFYDDAATLCQSVYLNYTS